MLSHTKTFLLNLDDVSYVFILLKLKTFDIFLYAEDLLRKEYFIRSVVVFIFEKFGLLSIKCKLYSQFCMFVM